MSAKKRTARPLRRAQRRKKQSPKIWQGLNQLIVLLIWIGAGVFVVFSIYPEWRRLQDMEQNLAREHKTLAEEELARLQREREVFLLESNTEYLETLARDRLDLMREGETIFRIQPPRRQEQDEGESP